MSKRLKVRPIEKDFAQAYARLHFGKWEELKALATQVAAERMIEANQTEQRRLIAASAGLTGAAYLKNSDAITRAFAEHDELLDIAYPKSTEEAIARRLGEVKP
jgi:predicted flavoprotein YhiN